VWPFYACGELQKNFSARNLSYVRNNGREGAPKDWPYAPTAGARPQSTHLSTRRGHESAGVARSATAGHPLAAQHPEIVSFNIFKRYPNLISFDAFKRYEV
jgi:hypothetical protein